MVVCPCGVMVPTAGGVGRASRRATRGTTGCFDTSSTVTSQPKEIQDTPASVEKLAAAAAANSTATSPTATDPSSIPRPSSRGGKNNNKGSSKGCEDFAKGDNSRSTLALATTESGRYVGTRPLKSNRSPTPTLHRLPQKSNSRDNLSGCTAVSGRTNTKHLPAVRTSPMTSPLDNQESGAYPGGYSGPPSRPPSRPGSATRIKPPTALPRQNGVALNAVNQRLNDINSNQRRLRVCIPPPTNFAAQSFKQNDGRGSSDRSCGTNLSQTSNADRSLYTNIPRKRARSVEGDESNFEGDEVVDKLPETSCIYRNAQQSRMQGPTDVVGHYENIKKTTEQNVTHEGITGGGKSDMKTEKEVIYENLKSLLGDETNPLNGHSRDVVSSADVTEKAPMRSSADSLTPDESLVWLSDSWKYNTIKKAPEFDLFEFSDIDQSVETTDESEQDDGNGEIEEGHEMEEGGSQFVNHAESNDENKRKVQSRRYIRPPTKIEGITKINTDTKTYTKKESNASPDKESNAQSREDSKNSAKQMSNDKKCGKISERGRVGSISKMGITLEQGKKKLRSKLPMFGWMKDKNKQKNDVKLKQQEDYDETRATDVQNYPKKSHKNPEVTRTIKNSQTSLWVLNADLKTDESTKEFVSKTKESEIYLPATHCPRTLKTSKANKSLRHERDLRIRKEEKGSHVDINPRTTNGPICCLENQISQPRTESILSIWENPATSPVMSSVMKSRNPNNLENPSETHEAKNKRHQPQEKRDRKNMSPQQKQQQQQQKQQHQQQQQQRGIPSSGSPLISPGLYHPSACTSASTSYRAPQTRCEGGGAIGGGVGVGDTTSIFSSSSSISSASSSNSCDSSLSSSSMTLHNSPQGIRAKKVMKEKNPCRKLSKVSSASSVSPFSSIPYSKTPASNSRTNKSSSSSSSSSSSKSSSSSSSSSSKEMKSKTINSTERNIEYSRSSSDRLAHRSHLPSAIRPIRQTSQVNIKQYLHNNDFQEAGNWREIKTTTNEAYNTVPSTRMKRQMHTKAKTSKLKNEDRYKTGRLDDKGSLKTNESEGEIGELENIRNTKIGKQTVGVTDETPDIENTRSKIPENVKEKQQELKQQSSTSIRLSSSQEEEKGREKEDEGKRKGEERGENMINKMRERIEDDVSSSRRPSSASESEAPRNSRAISRECHPELWKDATEYSSHIPGGFLPSPTPSCPTPVDEIQKPRPYQYHSLPQLHQDGMVAQRSRENDSYKPYYMGDLYKEHTPTLSRNRRTSQTSLIDQAVESLELLPLTAGESESSLNNMFSELSNVYLSEEEIVQSPIKSAVAATSSTLPALPVDGISHGNVSSDSESEIESESINTMTNQDSVCILSLDLTLDCEEFNTNGSNIIGFSNNTVDNKVSAKEIPHNVEMVIELKDEPLINEDIEINEDRHSRISSSLSIDDKYYENDDYDSVEDSDCDFISDEQQRQLDQSIKLLSEKHYKHLPKHNAPIGLKSEQDEEDFIDIDCDVQPMEALKRPLVYGYGTGPVNSRRRSTYLEKRLSQTSNMSEYMEMDIAANLCNTEANEEIRPKSESCMNLKETYWDYWQAKRGITRQQDNPSFSRKSSNSSASDFQNCPSEQFCYDPEVLLAHVRCPKSLEDATFRQYSAYVKSHIYDYFGNTPEALSNYGLSYGREWISSQPNLLPNTLRKSKLAGNNPLDYSSEPELNHDNGSASSYKIPPHLSSKRAPPPRPPPPPLHSRDSSQDSGTWTYLQSPESANGLTTRGAYPVPLPRSTSSLSHIGPVTYNPWLHLLPDVTPPRTPRHSLYYTSTTEANTSRSASNSPRRKSLIATPENKSMDIAEPHHKPVGTLNNSLSKTSQHPHAPTKRSFFPNLTKVVKSPLRKPLAQSKICEREDSMDVLSELPRVHPSIQKRTHTGNSSKSSSSSSSSSSGSSNASVTTVIPATARNKGPNWLMRHFGGAKSKMTAV